MQVEKQLSEWDRGDEKSCLHSSADHVQRSNMVGCYGMTWSPRCMAAINSTNATDRESKKSLCTLELTMPAFSGTTGQEAGKQLGHPSCAALRSLDGHGVASSGFPGAFSQGTAAFHSWSTSAG